MTCDLVVVGGSWGGLDAVSRLLDALPADFTSPIVVGLHRSPSSTHGLLEELLRPVSGGRPVTEVDDKSPIERNTVYLAPPDYHLLVERDEFALSVDQKVAYARPSIDVLFESAADAYGHQVVAVLLTGSNADGAAGMASVRRQGGITVAQDPVEAEKPEMPRAAIEAGAAVHVLPVSGIADLLAHVCGVRR